MPTLLEALAEKEGPQGPYRFILKHRDGEQYAPFYFLTAGFEPVAERGTFGWTPATGIPTDTRKVIQEFNRKAIRDALPSFAQALAAGVEG